MNKLLSRKFFKQNWQLLCFNSITVILFVLFYGHFGDVMVDSFREAYIPSQVINGQVLYKNIFTIYTPFAYLFNALIFKILGVNLQALYFVGIIVTIAILNFVFAIANKFMNKTYSLSIIFFLIAVSVLSPNVFNFIFPYSYGMLYGLLFILISIYFALKDKFQLAYLMYSFAICSKYEFIFVLPLLLYLTRKKDLLKNLISLMLPILLTFIPIIVMGGDFKNILTSFQIVLSMSTTKTLYWFYSVMGLVFRWQLIPIYIVNLLKVIIPLGFMYYFRSWWLIILTTVYFAFIANPEIIIYAFPLILLTVLFQFHKLSNEKLFFILASLLVSIKLFFAITLMSYGVFFVPFVMISFFILIPNRYKKALFIITLICAFVFGVKNSISLINKNTKIQTERGIVYAKSADSINDVITYIQKNTKVTDKVLVYPECLAINFLTNRETDNKFYSLIPLYVETFGEELIIKRIELTKPKYIIINNYDTGDYYYSYFGQDYAVEIYDYILKNYLLQKEVGNGMLFMIYKRKE